MSGHTPGPWNDVHVQGEGVKIIATGAFAPIGQRVAWVAADDTEQLSSGRIVERCSHEARANARLIAAAPDLLAACEAVEAAADAPMASGKRDGFTRPTEKQWREIVTQARAAIARARGESGGGR